MGRLGRKSDSAQIPRFPLLAPRNLTTFQDGQTAMAIHVVQGERELVDDCRSLARFVLRKYSGNGCRCCPHSGDIPSGC